MYYPNFATLHVNPHFPKCFFWRAINNVSGKVCSLWAFPCLWLQSPVPFSRCWISLPFLSLLFSFLLNKCKIKKSMWGGQASALLHKNEPMPWKRGGGGEWGSSPRGEYWEGSSQSASPKNGAIWNKTQQKRRKYVSSMRKLLKCHPKLHPFI